jgi:hypothetical protein
LAGIKLFEEQLRLMTPHTYNGLTKLVTAMADVRKNTGKKTFFGKDKGQESYSKFLHALKATMQAMVLDGVIRESTSTEDVATELEGKLEKFAMAYPNWQDAYGFAAFFLHDQREDAIATMNRLRSTP